MITSSCPSCPSCAAATRQTRAGFNRCGTQRLHCQHCRRYYTHQPKKKGYPPEVRRAALRMYVDGINLRRTARLVGVAPQTIVNWVKAACEALPTRPTPAQAQTVEMDELYTFLTLKKTLFTSAQQ